MSTTIPVSSVPAAVAYLVAAIQAQLTASTTTATLRQATRVYAGDPTSPDLPNDFVCVGRVTRPLKKGSMVGSGGARWLTEEYDIAVTISSWRGDQTENVVTQRAWQLVAFVETAVRKDPSLGGAVLEAYPSRSTSPGPVFTAQPVGPQVTVTETIHCSQSI